MPDPDPSRPLRLTFGGHATTLIELDGIRILTDPVLRGRLGPLRREPRAGAPMEPDAVDAVVISHTHWDHLDLPSLAALGRSTRLIVPRGAAGAMRRRGFSSVDELAPGESVSVGGVAILATEARHAGFGPPIGPTRRALGYRIQGSRSVYFAGDTDLFPAMSEIGEGLDVALLPVWGWGPVLGRGHLDPLRAASALRLLRPRFAVPIHWGTLTAVGFGRVRRSILTHPPQLFRREAQRRAEEVDVLVVVDPGESVDLS